MEEDDYSDSSDEDYVPNGGEAVSEEDDSGDEEDFVPGEDDETKDERTERHSKTPGIRRQRGCKAKASDNKSNCDSNDVNKKNDETEEMKELEEKRKVDALWADFKKDVGTTSKARSAIPSSSASSSSATTNSSSTSSVSSHPNTSSKITIQKEYDFAGETVVITKEVDANSEEAKSAVSSDTDRTNASSTTKASSLSSSASVAPTLKRPTGGLSSVLNKLNKKPKLSTLDKSKFDWDGFKQKEGIEEELKTHNRGKDGYLERVAFLERTDQRQFEIERKLRLGSSRKQ